MVRAMPRTPRQAGAFATVLTCLLSLSPAAAQAQEAAEPEAPTEETVEVPPPPAVTAPGIPESLRPRTPPPLMVAVFDARGVSDEWQAALRDGLVAQLTPVTGRRPVLGLAAPALREQLEACEEDACVGGILAEAQAGGAVFARLRRIGRRVRTTLEVRMPVEGLVLGELVEARLPLDLEALPEALPEVAAQLRPSLPEPPPEESTLLITVSADDALVRVDDEEVGRSPLAPFPIRTGEHQVVVTAEGYESATRRTRVSPAEHARVDVTLQSLDPEDRMIMTESGDLVRAGDRSVTDEDWFWPVVLGGGGAVLLIVGISVGVAVANSGDGQMDTGPTGFELPRIVGGM
jgi:hypothetical protein